MSRQWISWTLQLLQFSILNRDKPKFAGMTLWAAALPAESPTELEDQQTDLFQERKGHVKIVNVHLHHHFRWKNLSKNSRWCDQLHRLQKIKHSSSLNSLPSSSTKGLTFLVVITLFSILEFHSFAFQNFFVFFFKEIFCTRSKQTQWWIVTNNNLQQLLKLLFGCYTIHYSAKLVYNFSIVR